MPIKPLVSNVLKTTKFGSDTSVYGWVQSVRRMKNVAFADIMDGSTSRPLNIVFENPKTAENLSTGTCVHISGKLVESKGNQKVELQAQNINILGESPSDYPLQKKYHSSPFLRQLPQFRWKTRQATQVLKYRSWALQQFQNYFTENDTVQVNSPIVTSSDCEGAGEAFEIQNGTEFFGKPAYLTVSSQLHLEVFAASLSRVWNFTPAFRAEASDTNRHLSEFWMVEAELAFLDNLEDLVKYCEKMVGSAVPEATSTIAENLLSSKWDKEARNKLEARWKLASKPWTTMTYTEAIDLLNNSTKSPQTLKWGVDLPSEHEKHLANEIVKGPVVVTDYPEKIKPFYMKNNENGTVSCFDVLFPEVGEIVGGSMREDNYGLLKSRMDSLKMDTQKLQWYLDLRKYGSSPHGGYGLGFERLVMYLCGLDNIRDATGFIREHGHLPC